MSTLSWSIESPSGRSAVPMRLTARGRLALGALALVVAGAGIFGTSRAQAQAPAGPVAVEAVTVAAGQTLWQLAGRVVEPGQDIRDVVARLAELNGLDGVDIAAGQRLLLPVEG